MTSLEESCVSVSTTKNESWFNDFAEKLLSENFLLTALEFHAELTESGRELPKLKDYFSNLGNFENQASNKPETIQSVNLPRSSSQATLDSLDLARYSEDGERSNDERVAVLEFELRKAKETICALRANLTEATESEGNNYRLKKESFKENKIHNKEQISIKPHELRALNFLINEYLLLNGYKLTSITFADENESQDFEDWNDVGLNTPRPLELLYLYREGLKGNGYFSHVETKDFECQCMLYDEIQQNLLINKLESEILELNEKIKSKCLEFSNNEENQKLLERESCSLTPDPEYFEIIETHKLQEELETKSEKSNGEWTQIGDKYKKEIYELKSDCQSNFEYASSDEKMECHSSIFDVMDTKGEFLNEYKKTQELGLEIENEHGKIENNKLGNETKDLYEIIENSNKLNECTNKQENYGEILKIQNLKREVPEKFKNEMLKNCDINFSMFSNNDILSNWFLETSADQLSTNHLITVLSKSLPKIVPNIILNKREEITPLLVLCICFNSDVSIRDKLLNLLFNLKKKPQTEERRVILEALYMIGQLKGATTVENEILPQCWEQIGHKHVERRLLVAESCFVLAPFVSETIRNSLIISIAQQLMQDREEIVRKASVNILAILIILISDEEKYSQVLEICLQILNDDSPEVINSVKHLLFPILAQWSFNVNKIQSDLFYKLLNKIKKDKSLNVINIMEILLPYLVLTIANSEHLLKFSSNYRTSTNQSSEFSQLCKGLCNPALFFPKSLSQKMSVFELCTSIPEFDFSGWTELEWITDVFIPELLEVGDNFWEDNNVLKALMSTLRYLCLGLGRNVTNYKVKPFLAQKLVECENAVVSGQDCKYSIIPFYLVGVLSTYPEELQEMSNILRRFICALPLCGVSLIPLQVTVETLCQYQSWQILVLDAIWEGVVHQRPSVRSGSGTLLEYVIPKIPQSLVSTKIMPALVTLTSDQETSVRSSAIPALGMLINAKERAVKDKVQITFQTLLQDSISFENHNLIIQLVKTLGLIYELCERKFKEDVIISQLFSIVSLASRNKRKDLVEVLIEAFSTVTFSQSQVSLQCMSALVLPGLRNLESLCTYLNLSSHEQVNSMIKEVERRLSAFKETSASALATSPSAEGRRHVNAAAASQVVVEDVRNRVTKIFNAKSSTFQNVSGIFKKKT